ncbi:MAG: hypothetical protein B6241_05710 [Spirochaetaceae bacterium 4572_59]|nr:MAG: hypothetical protein B6241_05710 [Spirochaetaceae bacterium 4572_59]
MKSIQSVAIIGAGALGILFGEALKTYLKENLFYLADGSRYEKLLGGHFLINDVPENFVVKNSQDLTEFPDLVIVAVKNHHLEQILGLLKRCIRKDTIVLSVLNGIESEQFLEANFPHAHILYSIAIGMDAVRVSNQLTYSSRGKLMLGSKDNDKKNEQLNAVESLLDSCHIHYEIPEDIHRSIWWKWMINIGVNQVSAVSGANYKGFQTNRNVQLLMEAAMEETITVAHACGVDLRREDIQNWYPILNGLGPEGKSSMLQDMEACRKTEAPWFSGKLISLAEKHGINVPVNETLYRIILSKESFF